MATATMRPKGKKWQVRWRAGGGSAGYSYLSYDSDSEAQDAVNLINNRGCAITREQVISVKSKVPLETVVAIQQEVRQERAERLGSPTVEALIPLYLESISLETEPGTREKYLALLQTAWVPKIGAMRVKLVSDQDIRKVMERMSVCECRGEEWGFWCGRRRSNKKLTPGQPHEPGIEKRTQDRYYSAARGLFSYAVKKKYIDRSPVADSGYRTQALTRYNSTKKEEKHFYMTEEQFALLRSKLRPDLQTMLNLMAETGLRYSEVTALLVSQFESHPKPKVRINEVWKRSKEKKVYRGEPKGGATRDLRISGAMAMALEKACDGKPRDKLIFTTLDGFRLNASNFYRDVWEVALAEAQRCPEHPPASSLKMINYSDLDGPLCGDNGGRNARGRVCRSRVVVGTNRCRSHAGLTREEVSSCDCTDPKFPRRLPRRLTPHDIRHTYAAWMIKKKTHLSVMARRLGQATSQVTEQVYAGVLDEVDDQLAQESAINF